jgi:ABC-type transport system substrate-binding protein
LSRSSGSPRLSRRAALRLAALSALAGGGALLAGCGKSGRSSSSSNSGGGTQSADASGKVAGTLRYVLTTEPTTLDPAVVQDGPTIDLLQQVYQGLVGWGEKNEIVPLLAAAMPKVSADGRTYTFTIRDGAKFHNGRQVTAEDLKYSITRSLDPKLKSPVAMSYLNDIVGAAQVADGKATDLAGVKVVDPKTIAITIDKPRAYFLGKLTYATAYAVPKEEVEKGKLVDGARIIDETNAVGAGPFKLDSYVRQSKVTLAAFPEYWGGKPKLERIERPIVLDAQTARNLYDTGALDLLTLDKSQYEQDRNNAALKNEIKLWNRAATFYIGMNQTHYAPFKNRKFRQAVAHAIDKDTILQNVLLGVNPKAEGILPIGMPGYDPTIKGLPYDPEKAKALLAEAGYANGQNLPPLKLTFRQKTPDLAKTAQVVKEQLAAVGIPIELNEMEWGAYLKATHDHQVDFFHQRWSADYLDPQNFLSVLLRTGAPENNANYSNPAYDRLLDEADSTLDTKKRMALYNEAERMVVADAPWVPVYYQRDIELVKPHVTGIRDSLFGHLPHTTTTVG